MSVIAIGIELMLIEKCSHSHFVQTKESSSILPILAQTGFNTSIRQKNSINHCTGTQFNGNPNGPSSI